MSGSLKLRVGPHPTTGAPLLEIELEDRTVAIDLELVHAKALADRLRECIDGRACARPPSRRVLEMTLVAKEEAAE